MMEEAVYQCSNCGEVLLIARQEAHNKYWCEYADSDNVSEASEENASNMNTPSAPVASTSQQELLSAERADGAVDLQLARLPVPLRFNVQHVFGSNCTGGGLWHSELVLAEWCVQEICLRSPLASERMPRVLELGCGACPVAGVAALALGCDVLFTDLKPLLPLVETNIRLNSPVVVAARETIDCARISPDYCTSLSRRCCDTEELVFGAGLPSRTLSMAPFDFILCSDCVFRTDMHVALATTLRAVLEVGSGGTRCLVVFMERDAAIDMCFIDDVCPHHRLRATPSASISELIDGAPWNRDAGAASCLTRNCRLHEITAM
jgi:predicted nicotinamide N-methyase